MTKASLDIHFDSSAAVRVWSVTSKLPNVSVKVSPASLSRDTEEQTNPSESAGKPYPRGVYRGAVRPSGVRTAKSVPAHVAVKWATGTEDVCRLRYEAALYDGALRRLQGDVVPRFYGFFSAKANGNRVGCLILEWCRGAASFPLGDLNKMRMLAVCRLHQAGVVHGDLGARHFLLSQSGKVRIVDFSAAELHRCTGSLDEACGTCQEMDAMQVRLGIDSEGWPVHEYLSRNCQGTLDVIPTSSMLL